MRSGSSGLQRDLNVVRRRAWLFIPFAILGIVVAFAFGSVAGDANAAATMQLETVVHDLFAGGDRGLRIFEAQSMTGDKEFKEKVLAATGLPPAGYARYSIALSPISVADGVSRGTFTVSIKDPNKAEAERLRNAFVDIFTKEYVEKDGLFRSRFVSNRKAVADVAEAQYLSSLNKVKPLAQAHRVPVEELIRSANNVRTGLSDELTTQEANLLVEQSRLATALSGPISGASASAALGRSVADADAAAVLRAEKASVDAALAAVQERRYQLSDASFTTEERAVIDEARAFVSARNSGAASLANARSAVISAESHIETSYTFSGGVAGTWLGRVAVAVAVALVSGLIAIYLLEWLSQVRTGPEGRIA